MFSFQSIGSGSSGNSYYLQTDAGALMIDAGVAIRKLRKQMYEYGLSVGRLAGVLVTHHHIDHTRSLGILNQKDGLRIYMTEKTKNGIMYNPSITKKPSAERTTIIRQAEPFALLDMQITPFDVPHDSKDNTGFLICHGSTRLCIVTDCARHMRPTLPGSWIRRSIIHRHPNHVLPPRAPPPYSTSLTVVSEADRYFHASACFLNSFIFTSPAAILLLFFV